MISELYKQLEALATSEFGDVVEDAELIPSYTGRVRKLRIILIDQTFVDVWYTADGSGPTPSGLRPVDQPRVS